MPPRPRALVGAHVSVAGGLSRALTRAREIGAETIQIFVANPRAWAPPPPDPQGDAAFAEACELPVFVHAPYLINFGSPAAATLARSGDALAFSLRRAAAIGAQGVVVHAGSAVLGNRWEDAMRQVRESVLGVLDAIPEAPRLLIEPTAGGGGALAAGPESLAAYLDALGRDERLGVCLDTCHAHAAGCDLSTAARFAATLRSYLRAAGPGRVGLIHVNDSRDLLGSKRDRHESIGRGTIGLEPFRALFSVPATRHIPLVVETVDEAQAGDISALKDLRSGR